MGYRNIKYLKNQILNIYSDNFSSRYYTFLRLKLTPIVKLEKYVPMEGNILDLGCGTGIFANILVLGSNKRNILGVDLSHKRIEIARRASRKRSQIKYLVGDVNNFLLDGYHIITLIDLLHHMPYSQQDYLLDKIYTHLPDGGMILIKDLEKAPLWKYIFHYIQDSIAYKGSALYFRSVDEMNSLLKSIGFSVSTFRLSCGYAYPHVLYKCVKLPKNNINHRGV